MPNLNYAQAWESGAAGDPDSGNSDFSLCNR